MNNVRNQLSEYENKYEQAEEDTDKLKEDLDAVRRQKDFFESKYRSLTEEVKSLESRLEQAQNDFKETTGAKNAEIEALRKRLADAEAELQSLAPLRAPLEHAIDVSLLICRV